MKRDSMRAICFLFCYFPFSLFADVKIAEKIQYYSVNPVSNQDIKNALNLASPVIEQGNVFFARTQYDIKWRFWWRTNKQDCMLTKVHVDLAIVYTLPKLADSKRKVITDWSHWYDNLLIHEKGHASFAVKTAHDIDKTLRLVKPAINCETLELNANRQARQLMTQLKRTNINYDKSTGHGKTQGAWLK
jgi:predicted secreted Zn-dependent protease